MRISKTRLRMGLFIGVLLSFGLALCLSYPKKSDFVFDVFLAIAIVGGFEYLIHLSVSAFKRRSDKNPLLEK
jgi:hypothetical protein